jgi:CRISPR-associated protein Cas1
MKPPERQLWACVAKSEPVAPFATVFSPPALADGFARVARSGGGPGADGQSVAKFALDGRAGLNRLSREILDGTYQPQRLLRHNLRKPGGGVRQLAIPSVRDRIAQAALASALDAAFDPVMSSASFAYRRGLSVQHAAALVAFWQLRGYGYALDGDIESFFDCVPHAGLMAMLSGLGVCPQSAAIVQLWLSGHAKAGLPQGSPLSPVLSNLYLLPFDKGIESKRFRLVRYADDFLVLTRSRPEAEAAKQRAITLLAQLGLTLSPAKTRIAKLSEGVNFLGLSIKGGWMG